MKHLLVKIMSGTIFAGEIVPDNEDDMWLGIRQSGRSDILIFINKDFIETIYYINGEVERYKSTEQRKDGSEKSIIPEDDLKLIRVKGGISYRGSVNKSICDKFQDGYWIMPTKINDIRIYIPFSEVEEVFSLE